MVMAAWVKKRQLKQGRVEERKLANAKMRAWAKEKGIPVEELPIEDESESG